MSIGMQTVYMGAAVLGGLVLLIQVALAIFGADADADLDVDVGGDLGGDADLDHGGGISVRTVVAFITFFGMGGWAAMESGYPGWPSLVAALVIGSLAFWITGLVMAQLYRLRSSGTIDIQNTLGVEGKVYLTVPAGKSSAGSVTVPIQGRTMQFRAITAGRELKTGELCKVVAVAGGDTLEVESI